MRKAVIVLAVVLALCTPAHALDMTAPAVPPEGADLMPEDPQSFPEAVTEILGDALSYFYPDLREAVEACSGVLAVFLVVSLAAAFPGRRKGIAELTGTLMTAAILLRTTNALITLGTQTVEQLSEYGKLLLPVMTAALAAQGGVSSAAAIYTGTAVFDAVISHMVSKLLVPAIYLFLALGIGHAALGDPMLKKLRECISAAATWCLKTVLYVYTGYISITGVVSGTTDASILKAAKLTISGVVPVVGGILSDASEAVLVSAGTVKNSAGIYGMLALMAVWIGPFLKIGAHYLILKILNAVCAVLGFQQGTDLVSDFSTAMGLLLAMTGAVCLMLIISTICFMKGVGI